MNEIIGERRVHLDHLIERQSLRYTPGGAGAYSQSNQLSAEFLPTNSDENLRYSDIANSSWIRYLRKPDFQRETNAWTPEDCVEFLDTVVKSRIIPSIILWYSKESGYIYALDGAHRLSVIRAWMIDDWGDKAGKYYERRDFTLIKSIADETRTLVRKRIGSFEDFSESHKKFMEIVEKGEAPKKVMEPPKYARAIFYNLAMVKHQTLSIQREHGDYESAEQSFLRINRKGQALDPWEATLIEYRHSSYARSIMCIANGGESGHYWPSQPESEIQSQDLADKVNSFSQRAKNIYEQLFVPPYRLPISDLNVPLMVAPAYFQKHKYLLEIVPLIKDKIIALSEEQQIEIMKRDYTAPANVVIENAEEILKSLEGGVEHIVSPTHNSTSLAIVPLFYWYNQKAQFVRGLFYGFVYWLISGTDREIADRKIIFSANRRAFEYNLFNLKGEISTLQDKGGAGLKGTSKIREFFQDFLDTIQSNSILPVESDELQEKVIETLSKYVNISKNSKRNLKSSRTYSRTDKTQINIRELFEHSIKCHICGGIVNIQYGGVQYDHVDDYADVKVTDPENGKPTHPFCNRNKKQIQSIQAGKQKVELPVLIGKPKSHLGTTQLDFWGLFDEFPE